MIASVTRRPSMNARGRSGGRTADGRHSTTRPERPCGGLYLRPSRSWVCAHLPSNRTRELRAGRPADARRIHLLHARRLVWDRLLACFRTFHRNCWPVRRATRQDRAAPSTRPASVHRSYADDRPRRDFSQFRLYNVGVGDLLTPNAVQCQANSYRRCQY